MNTNDVGDFLSGCFHEDWEIEAETDEEVVSLFRQFGGPAASIEALADKLEAEASGRESETSDEWLLNDHGCYYKPSVDGLSGSNWLRRLAAFLRDSSSPTSDTTKP